MNVPLLSVLQWGTNGSSGLTGMYSQGRGLSQTTRQYENMIGQMTEWMAQIGEIKSEIRHTGKG
jgi:hypothetical protein